MEKNRLIVKVSGHQYLVSPGARLVVNRLPESVGEVVTTADLLTGATVHLRVIEHQRGQKIHGLKFKNKTRYLRRWGHRQELTALQVEESPQAIKVEAAAVVGKKGPVKTVKKIVKKTVKPKTATSPKTVVKPKTPVKRTAAAKKL